MTYIGISDLGLDGASQEDARAASHRMLGLPRCVAQGRGPLEGVRLTPADLVLFAHYLDSADIKSRTHTINVARAQSRTAAKSPETIHARTLVLAAAGLITITSYTPRGAPKTISVPPVPSTARLSVPVALLWPTDDPHCPPRWGRSQTGYALRAILALLHVAADFGRDGHVGRVRDIPARTIADKARWNARDYRRGLAVITGTGPAVGTGRKGYEGRTAESGWLILSPRTHVRENGQWRQCANRTTLAWDLLPTQVIGYRPRLTDTRPPRVDVAVHLEKTAHGEPENRSAGQVENPSRVAPVTPHQLLSDTSSSSSLPTARPVTTQPARNRDEEERRDVIDVAILRAVVAADRADLTCRLGAAIQDAGGEAALSDDSWVALVLANASVIPEGHAALIVTAREVVGLRSPLLAARRAGWTAHALAAALTDGSYEGSRSRYAVARKRLSAAVAAGCAGSPQEVPGAVWMTPRETAPRIAARESAAEAIARQSRGRDPRSFTHVM